MKTLPIVFACDKSYFKYTSVAICSLISNANKEVYYKIYVLSQDIDEKDQILMTEFIKGYKNFSLEFIIFNNIDTSKFYVKDYYTISTYFRFYILELFKQYDRVLYLDSDLVVDTDISEFADMDFEDKVAIAVQDTKHCKMLEAGGEYWYTLDYFYNTLKMETIQQYFNAGVILFNVKRMNDGNISEKLFHNLAEIGNPILQDQDVINCVLSKYNGGG